MASIIKKKEAAVVLKEIIVRNTTEDININAQAEELLKSIVHLKRKMSVFRNLSKEITKIKLLYKEKRWMHA